MKTTQNFHRKRPHLLPPLPKLEPAFRPMDPLLAPDLLLTENRLGSPAPRRNDSRECDYMDNINKGKPVIKIFEACPKKCEKNNMQLDLLSDAVFDEDSYLFQGKNSNVCELDGIKCGRDNEYAKNLMEKKSDCLCDDLSKKLRSHAVFPLKDLKSASEPNIIPIPNRYKPLKPIGPDVLEK